MKSKTKIFSMYETLPNFMASQPNNRTITVSDFSLISVKIPNIHKSKSNHDIDYYARYCREIPNIECLRSAEII